jgi:hypothetical protein
MSIDDKTKKADPGARDAKTEKRARPTRPGAWSFGSQPTFDQWLFSVGSMPSFVQSRSFAVRSLF